MEYPHEQTAPTSLLLPGRTFNGTQRMTESTPDLEVWKVKMTIEEADCKNGYLSGSMYAGNVPGTENSSPIISWFDAEIIDGENYFFSTGERWVTNYQIDMKHWTKFPAFVEWSAKLLESHEGMDVSHVLHCTAEDLKDCDAVFLRLKERFFIQCDPMANLTIAGFYYMCYDIKTQTLSGYYYDPHSQPFQKLELKWDGETRLGSYDFA